LGDGRDCGAAKVGEKMAKTYQERIKDCGVVTDEIWSDPAFRAKMYDTILDAGASVEYDKTQSTCIEDIRKPEGTNPISC
jgi:hypothetical protein